MTPAEQAARLDRIRAERAKIGRSDTIQSPSVYAIAAAVLAASQSKPATTQ